MDAGFEWIDAYTKIANALLPYKTKQKELLNFIYSMFDKMGITNNYLQDKQTVAGVNFDKIDPFTVMGIFNRNNTTANRIAIINHFLSFLKIEVEAPTNFDGIPILNGMLSCFFGGKEYNRGTHIDKLWELFETGIKLADTPSTETEAQFIKLFDFVISQPCSKWLTTMGLFWIRAYHFIPLDGNTRAYLNNNLSLGYKFNKIPNGRSYLNMCAEIKTILGENGDLSSFPALSQAAWIKAKNSNITTAYWLGGASYGSGDMSPEFIDNGVYAIDFGSEDISEIVTSSEELNKWIKSLSEASAKSAFELLCKMKAGDKIAIKSAWAKGKVSMLRIKAIGTVLDSVESGYAYDKHLGHTIPVEWEPVDPNIDYKIGGYLKTIHSVTKKLDIDTIFGKGLAGQPSKPDDDTISIDTILNCLGGLKKQHSILKNAKLFELNDSSKVLIRTSKLLSTGYFYGLQKSIVDENIEIDYMVLAKGSEGFYRIPYAVIYELCINGSFSLADKRESSEGYRIHLSSSGGEYKFKFPGDKEPMSIEKYYTSFAYDKSDFLNDVYMTSQKYDDITALLERKKNIILQGAPGVGKSYLAKRLAYSVLGLRDASKVEMVQFHQSYTYEDFIEGFRPAENAHFEVRQGVFYRFCQRAKNDKANKYFFIIDEINRGNLSKIMGELMLLIEHDKRGAEFSMPLTYSSERFYVPENIYIIGMMNTADRSLAMIDYALRRRFSFIPIEPAFENERFIADFGANYADADTVIEKMKKLNALIKAELDEGHLIGHSYFCSDKALAESDIDGIFRYEISELLREYFFDNESKLNEALKLL